MISTKGLVLVIEFDVAVKISINDLVMETVSAWVIIVSILMVETEIVTDNSVLLSDFVALVMVIAFALVIVDKEALVTVIASYDQVLSFSFAALVMMIEFVVLVMVIVCALVMVG